MSFTDRMTLKNHSHDSLSPEHGSLISRKFSFMGLANNAMEIRPSNQAGPYTSSAG